MRFGPNSVSSEAYGTFSGPSIGFYVFSLMQGNVGQKLEGYFLTGDPANPNFSQYLGIGSLRLNGTPTNGTVYKFSTSMTTGLKDFETVNTLLYPNPAQNVIYSTQEIDTYKIIDLNGRVLDAMEPRGGRSININKLSSGVYILQLQLTNGDIIRERLVKN